MELLNGWLAGGEKDEIEKLLMIDGDNGESFVHGVMNGEMDDEKKWKIAGTLSYAFGEWCGRAWWREN